MVILEAAVDELAEVGYGGVTIESVAARAGVGKSTIYRHWPDKLALIADAFETFHVQMVPDVEDRSARESVETLLGHVAEVVLDSTWSRCIPALIEGAERDRRVREFHHGYSAERRHELTDVIARGTRRARCRARSRRSVRDAARPSSRGGTRVRAGLARRLRSGPGCSGTRSNRGPPRRRGRGASPRTRVPSGPRRPEPSAHETSRTHRRSARACPASAGRSSTCRRRLARPPTRS